MKRSAYYAGSGVPVLTLILLGLYLLDAFPFSLLPIHDTFARCDLLLAPQNTSLCPGDRSILELEVLANKRSRIRFCHDPSRTVHIRIQRKTTAEEHEKGDHVALLPVPKAPFQRPRPSAYTTIVLERGEQVVREIPLELRRMDVSGSVVLDLACYGVSEPISSGTYWIWCHLLPVRPSLGDSCEDFSNRIEIDVVLPEDSPTPGIHDLPVRSQSTPSCANIQPGPK